MAGLFFSWCLGVLVVFLPGCASVPQKTSLQRFEYVQLEMGSLFRLTFFADNKTNADAAAVATFERVEELNRIMSDYDPQSELMQLCARPVGEPTRVSKDLFRILQASQKLSEESDGAFDVTVGPFVQLWRNARKTKILPAENEIAEARKAVGWRKLKLDSVKQTATLLAPNMKLDLGGIAKGFAANEALLILKRQGIRRAMVAASGDIAAGDAPAGDKGWKIGVGKMDVAAVYDRRAPDGRRSQTAATLTLKHCGVSTSGDAEQFVEIGGKRYSHIVNPKTGLGLTNRIQATVIAPTATQSDSFATAVCILGAESGLRLIESQRGMDVFIVVKTSGTNEVVESRHFRH